MSEKIGTNWVGEKPKPIDNEWEKVMNSRDEAVRDPETRKVLENIGTMNTTGAYVLDKEGNQAGVVPNLPKKYELSNLNYANSIKDSLAFLDAFTFDRMKELMADNRQAGNTEAYESIKKERQENTAKLIAERQYTDNLEQFFSSADDETKRKISDENIVGIKVKEDMAQNRAKKEEYINRLKEAGTDLENPVTQQVIASYDRDYNAMFSVNKRLHKKFVKGETVEGA